MHLTRATKSSFFAVVLALASACGTDELLEDDESDDVDEESEITQASYSPWIYYSGLGVRVCQTSTRVYWQYTGNTRYPTASSWGTNISVMSSSVGYSGSKYRTKTGTLWFFDVQFSGNGTSAPYAFYNFPSC
jgi:hypothetical protein